VKGKGTGGREIVILQACRRIMKHAKNGLKGWRGTRKKKKWVNSIKVTVYIHGNITANPFCTINIH
jgi:hypothetical protein